jgi:hypothetical protein
MKRLASVAFVISASLVLLADVAAARVPRSPFRLLQLARTAADPILIPPEWDGIWAITDTTYDCNGVPQLTSASEDTLCSGAVFLDPADITGNVICSGTTTATTIDITCAGTDTLFEDCVGTFTYNIRGTRSGNSAFLVATFSSTFDGTAPECAFIPDDCSQVNSHGTRTGPAPAAYCATPTLPSTWGGVKIRYR